MAKTKTNDITLTAMFVALVMAATYIGFPTPASMGGYVHFGTLVMITISLKYGSKYGMIAGGIGMTLFDVFSPWIVWAPGTLVVRLLMGFVIGSVSNDNELGQGNNLTKNIIAVLIGAIIMIGGYFLYQAFLMQIFEGLFSVTDTDAGIAFALTSIPGNVAQIVVGIGSFYLIKKLPTKEELNIT